MGPADRISYLINRYKNNSCTRREMDELLDYIQKHPQDEVLAHIFQDIWKTEGTNGDDNVLVWSDMQEVIRNTPSRADQRYRGKIFWRAAACVLLLIIAYGGFRISGQRARLESADASSLINKTVQTTNGEHRLTVLPDGSKVWINGSSKVVSAPDFNSQTREVTLYGEAFFDIRPDVGRPFIIKTGDVKTTVLGTAFNIRAFPEEREVIVTVSRGKVRVQAENQEAGTVTANEQITVHLESEEVEAKPVDAAAVTQWIKDDLILHEVTLDEVEEILEELYAVNIMFDNPDLKDCRFTSTFLKDATLKEVLTAICMVNGAKFTTNGKAITIYGEGCNAPVSTGS